jgi:hypothetical protein
LVASKPGPKWASWSYNVKHLPLAFHADVKPFEDFINWLKTKPYCSQSMVPYPLSKVLTVCLGIGLVLRDLKFTQATLGEQEAECGAPGYLRSSKLVWAHTNALLHTCNNIQANLQMIQEEIMTPGIEQVELEQEEGQIIPSQVVFLSEEQDQRPRKKIRKEKMVAPLRSVMSYKKLMDL